MADNQPTIPECLITLIKVMEDINMSLCLIGKRLDKMDINQQASMNKLIELFKEDKTVS